MTITPSSSFDERITPNIQLGEMALWVEARRFQYQHQIDTARELCEFLERVRRNLGDKPIIITSGYRPPAINRSVGGASGSEHLYSQPNDGAVDFYVKGVSPYVAEKFCDRYWPYSVGYGAVRGFVHLGRRADNGRRRWNY